MITRFRLVEWNRRKVIYDAILLSSVTVYITGSMIIGRWWLSRADDPASWEDLRIRAFGTCAFVMLTIILSIGPLARLNTKFLPVLYNRRHFGVLTFFIASAHAWFNIDWFLSRGREADLISIVTSWSNYATITLFPYEALGMIAITILFFMAATSHDFWLKHLTPKVWKMLHMAVYIAYGLLVMHVALGVMQTQHSLVIPILLSAAAIIVCFLHLCAGWRERSIDRGTATSKQGWILVGPPLSIPDGAARIVASERGERIAVFRKADQIGALTNVCAHQNGPLGEGRIIGGYVTCPWHGHQYRLEDGCAPEPFTDKIATHRVRINEGIVEVDSTPLLPGTRVALACWNHAVTQGHSMNQPAPREVEPTTIAAARCLRGAGHQPKKGDGADP